jgi:NAD(P)-dependent dehydrogenase (short-subunit alcohol dehydrogenase family)
VTAADGAIAGRLRGRRGLLTGAAGGIGARIARALADEGCALVLAGRRADALAELAGSLADAGPAVGARVLDVCDPVAVAAAVDAAAAELGGLDLVVNAAAVDFGWAPAGEMAVADWQTTIDINLNGTYYVCRAALPHLEQSGAGAIVSITSVAGLRAWAEDCAYNAAKAGVELLTRTIAVEYAERGVRANCVAPGVIDAGLTDVVTEPAEREALIALHPMRRMGTTAEVAEAVVWLASAAASFTTGSTILVDGGFLA